MRPLRLPTTLLALLLGLAAALPTLGSARPDDAILARSVRERLDRDPRLLMFDLAVDVRDAVAVLGGTVPTLADALEARTIAGAVQGVEAVDSRLDLASRGRPDREIAVDLRDRFESNGDLAEAGLGITVQGGAVLLTGSVNDSRVRAVARQVAARVAGVLGIADEIEAPETELDLAEKEENDR